MKKEKIINIITRCALVFCIVAFAFGLGGRWYRYHQSKEVTAVCEVTDKYYRVVNSRYGSHNVYYFSVSCDIEGFGKSTKEIGVSKDTWDAFLIGDFVSCIVTYDTYGILDVEFMERIEETVSTE